MNKEEKEAIERLDRKLTSEKFTKNIGMPVYIKDVEIVLNLIQKQEKEIELLSKKIYLCTPEIPQHEHQEYVSYVDLVDKIMKQEKIINAMKYRVVLTKEEHQMILKMLEKRSNKRYEDCVIEYFKKEVEKEC